MNSLKFFGFVVRIALMVLLIVSFACAQQANPENATAEQVYKNIQVMKGTPANQFIQSMHLIKADVGLDCEDCHVESDRSLDTLEPKKIARDMMRMVNELNKNSFQGKQMVTCYTCHRGSPHPSTVPDLPVHEWKEPAKLPLPTVDQILTKYVDALGGEQALRKVTSRVVTGTQYIPSGPGGTVLAPASVEKFTKAPNFSLNLYHTGTYTIADGFDGKTAWSQNIQGAVTNAPSIDQARVSRSADFYEPLKLKREYRQMTVDGIESVNGHDAYVLTGVLQPDLPRERLYFDTLTGLLVRKYSALKTQVGDSPYEVTYEDYCDSGNGVKFPYRITMSPAAPRIELHPTTTLFVTKVEENVAIDDLKFVKPASKPATGR
jgi:hypothetical protein